MSNWFNKSTDNSRQQSTNGNISNSNVNFGDTVTNIINVPKKILIGIVALLLMAGLYQTNQIVSGAELQQRQIADMIATAKQLQQGSNYAQAFATLEQALAITEQKAGLTPNFISRLDEEIITIRQAQLELSMRWLQNLRLKENQTFSEVADKLLVILSREAQAATGSQKADIVAHIGWANFLKARDGIPYNPEQDYRSALALDANNVYAHLYLGHWLLWDGSNIAEAKQHFIAAMQTKRDLPVVYKISFSALHNMRDNPQADALYIQFANELRKTDTVINEDIFSNVRKIYYFALSRQKDFLAFLAAVPASEQIELIKLLPSQEMNYGHDFLKEPSIAILYELAGQKEQALQIWQALAVDLRKQKLTGSILGMTEDALHRLTSKNK